ncbi:MAG: hypothetical protein EB078_11570 [Proteobacteria bacterium]|nr:hypothetical protein [Pseudomonadota bacterium]NDD05538.1 hypothetical protein [Pseudomonadota bacterium]NDG28142.1 hypothetical protein [Pseudomonadota bacterium]
MKTLLFFVGIVLVTTGHANPWDLLQARLRDVEGDWKKAVAQAHQEADYAHAGIEALGQLREKLAQNQGHFSETEKRSLNQLFEKFLQVSLDKDGIDGVQVPYYLHWAIQRLQELEKSHRNPNPQNNPRLAILFRERKEAKEELQKLRNFAKKRANPGNRVPASSDTNY